MPIYLTTNNTTAANDIFEVPTAISWRTDCFAPNVMTTTAGATYPIFTNQTVTLRFLTTGTSTRFHDPRIEGVVWEQPTEEQIQRDIKARQTVIRAEKKAKKLLLRSLPRRQKRQFKKKGWFTVYGPSRVCYRVRKEQGQLEVLDGDGKVKERLCVYPPGVPRADVMLAQKLMLEANEKEFLAIANRRAA